MLQASCNLLYMPCIKAGWMDGWREGGRDGDSLVLMLLCMHNTHDAEVPNHDVSLNALQG